MKVDDSDTSPSKCEPVVYEAFATMMMRERHPDDRQSRNHAAPDGGLTMLYLVRMDVELPPAMSLTESTALKDRERSYSQALQRDGRWRELWRVVGEYANYSVFDVAGNDELHELLSALPLYPYMRIHVTALTAHPSRIPDPDRVTTDPSTAPRI